MSAGELISKGDMVPEVPPQSPDLISVIERLAVDPRVDIDKLERIIALKERMIADQRKQEFMAAMARVAPKIPPIDQHGRIEVNGVLRSKYALLEQIDEILRPIISEEGLSLSFDTEMIEGGKIRVSCRLSHSGGHSEVKSIPLPIDKTGSKNDTQAVVSTVSYGRKALTKMFFNIMERGSDDDGQGGSAPISTEQVKDLEALITEVKADRARFLSYMNAPNLEAILSRDFGKAVAALEAKRKVSQK